MNNEAKRQREEGSNDNKQLIQQQALINYTFFINKGTNEFKQKKYSLADYYLYLALQASNIDLISILKVLVVRSEIYYEHYKDPKMLLYFSMKIMKVFSLILDYINESRVLIDISLVFYRTGILLQSLTNCNPVIPFYLFTVGRRLIQMKKVPIDESQQDYYDKHYKESRNKLGSELKNIRESYYDIVSLNGEEFLQSEHETQYTVLSELHKGMKDFDHTGTTINPGEECYLVSHKWRRKYKQFLEKLLSWKNSPLYYNMFLNKGFDPRIQYYNFIEEDNNQIYDDCPYICSINNFWLESFKDAWIPINSDEAEEDDYMTVFVSSFILQEDYAVVKKETWNELVKNFGCVNEIKRMKLSNGEIELQLKRLKVMVLNRGILGDEKESRIHMLRPRVVQMSKENTLGDFMSKMSRCLGEEYTTSHKEKEKEKKMTEYHYYLVNTSKMTIIQKKQLIFEIMLSYNQRNIGHINLNCEEISLNHTKSIESLGDKCLIIIERQDEQHPFIHPYTHTSACRVCPNKTTQLLHCSQCNANLLDSYWYCSEQCQTNDSDHQWYHKELSNLLYIRTTIKELRQLPLMKLLPEVKNNNGRVGLINISNNSHINSILQCITHCEELTKYFLSKRFINEINQLDQESSYKNSIEIPNGYYDLIKMLWIDNASIGNPSSFIDALSLEGYYDTKRDPHTFLLYLLEKLHMNLNRNNIGAASPNEGGGTKGNTSKRINKKKSDIENSDMLWQQYKSKEDSIIVDLFHGQLKHIIICPNCGKQKVAFDPFIDLSLLLPRELYLIKFAFFPLTSGSSSYSHPIDSINSTTSMIDNDTDLLYYEYEATISKNNIQPEHFISVILSKHTEPLSPVFDFVLLKPNKQWVKLLEFTDDINDSLEIFNYLQQGYYIAVYERKDMHSPNIYVYPCEFISQTKYLIVPYTQVNILAYPIAISITKKERVNDCYDKIKRLLRRIMSRSDYKQYIAFNTRMTTKDNEEQKLFKLHIYNTKKVSDSIEPSTPLGAITSAIGSIASIVTSPKAISSMIFDTDTKASTLCDFCGLNCDYCGLYDRFNQNEDFNYVFSHLTNDHPLILYAEMISYDHNQLSELYDVHSNDLIGEYAKNTAIASKHNITLDDCLNRFINEDKVDNGDEWYCSNCNSQNGNVTIKHEIFKAPPYLLIHLRRDNHITLTVPDTLDMTNYLNTKGKGLGVFISKEEALYDLSSKCCYSLNDSKITYQSLCKVITEERDSPWLLFNDDKVIESSSAFNMKDYILFYRKRIV